MLAGCGSEPRAAANNVEGYAVSEGALLVAACSSCHLSQDGTGGMASLTGWTAADMRAALLRYKTEPDGITVMHRLARGYSDAEITLIEPKSSYWACPLSNLVIGGLRDMAQQRFDYGEMQEAGVSVIQERPQKRCRMLGKRAGRRTS